MAHRLPKQYTMKRFHGLTLDCKVLVSPAPVEASFFPIKAHNLLTYWTSVIFGCLKWFMSALFPVCKGREVFAHAQKHSSIGEDFAPCPIHPWFSNFSANQRSPQSLWKNLASVQMDPNCGLSICR